MHSDPLKNTQCQQKLHKLRLQIRNRQIEQYKHNIRKQYLSEARPPSGNCTASQGRWALGYGDQLSGKCTHNSNKSLNASVSMGMGTGMNNSYMHYLQKLDDSALVKQIDEVLSSSAKLQAKYNKQQLCRNHNTNEYPWLTQHPHQHKHGQHGKLIDILIHTQDKYPHLYTPLPLLSSSPPYKAHTQLVTKIQQILWLLSKHNTNAWSIEHTCIVSYYMEAIMSYWLDIHEKKEEGEGEREGDGVIDYGRFMYVIQLVSNYIGNRLSKEYEHEDGHTNRRGDEDNGDGKRCKNNGRRDRHNGVLDISKIQQYILMELVSAWAYALAWADIPGLVSSQAGRQMNPHPNEGHGDYGKQYGQHQCQHRNQGHNEYGNGNRDNSQITMGRLASITSTLNQSYTAYLRLYLQEQEFYCILPKGNNTYHKGQHKEQHNTYHKEQQNNTQSQSQIGNINLQSLKLMLSLHTQLIRIYIGTLEGLSLDLYTHPELQSSSNPSTFSTRLRINKQHEQYMHTLFKQRIQVAINAVIELHMQLGCIVGHLPCPVFRGLEDGTSNGIYETVIGGMLGLADGVVDGVRLLEAIEEKRDSVVGAWLNWNRNVASEQDIAQIQKLSQPLGYNTKYSKTWFQKIKLRQLIHSINNLISKPLYVKQYITQLYTYSKLPIFILMCIFNTTPIYLPLDQGESNSIHPQINNYEQYRKSRSRFRQNVCLEMECLKLIQSLLLGYSIKVDSEDNLQVRYLKKVGDGSPNQFYFARLSGLN